MQLTSIPSTPPTMPLLNPVLVSRPAAVSSSAPASAQSPAQAPASSSTTSAAPAAPATHARSSLAHAAPAASASSSVAEMQAVSFSTTVGGKQYSGSVDESNGQYTASVSSLPGVSANGPSVIAAEDALYIRIDELV